MVLGISKTEYTSYTIISKSDDYTCGPTATNYPEPDKKSPFERRRDASPKFQNKRRKFIEYGKAMGYLP